ncbi:MAG TPA: hypothetical protein VLZ89_16430, partial [Anaerolineales bacterium]|nr:hypothetical protein [Anaerolineales bacterium]
MRFLIVDDTTRARQRMKALLEVWHPSEEVREAVNGTEAVKLAKEFQPDFIFHNLFQIHRHIRPDLIGAFYGWPISNCAIR